MKLISSMSSKQVILWLLVGSVVYLSYRLLQPMFTLIMVSFIVSSLSQGIYSGFFRLFRRHRIISVVMTMLAILIIILVPMYAAFQITLSSLMTINRDLTTMATNQGITFQTVVDQLNQATALVPGYDSQITAEELAVQVQEAIKPVSNWAVGVLLQIGAASPEIMARFFMFAILVAAMLPNQAVILGYLRRCLPLSERIVDLYINSFFMMTSSMIKGTVVISLTQALMAGLLLWMVGVPYVLFLIVLMTFLGILPVVGYSLIAVPAGIILILSGQPIQGLVVILLSIIIISNIDNVLRPLLVPKEAAMPAAIVLLGVFGGLQAFGPIGIIYGPIIMAFLKTSLDLIANQQTADV